MKCWACSNEYPKPDKVGDITYFVCSTCGHVLEFKNYHENTKDQIIEKIEEAFSGVVLGQGTGLFEAQALDDYASEEVQKRQREGDEKINWNLIPHGVLQRCHSSLSFFDANGMKFHLPAYIIGSLKGEVDDPIFHLTDLGAFMESSFVTFSALQKKAVTEYLTWCLTEEDYEYDYPNIFNALTEYWLEPYE